MKPKERNFLEASAEGAEAAMDLFVNSEAIEAIPFVGVAFKVARGYADLRSRIFTSKIRKFVDEPALRRAAEAGKLRAKIQNDEVEHTRVGEALLLVLEQVPDMQKPALLAKLYCAYLDEVINVKQLLRLIHCVDRAYIEDLSEMLSTANGMGREEWRQNLSSVGFMTVETGKTWNTDGEVTYTETSIAYAFRMAIAHANAPASPPIHFITPFDDEKLRPTRPVNQP